MTILAGQVKLGDRVRLVGSPRVGQIDSVTPSTFYVEWLGEGVALRQMFHFGAENLVELMEIPCIVCKRSLRWEEPQCWWCGTKKEVKS